jgi:diguanylate cyclase (GGDEF)-like protein
MQPPVLSHDAPVQLAPGLWWVGAPAPSGEGLVHAYLVQAGNAGVLVDPGSAFTIDATLAKVVQVLPLSQVRAVVVHSADPEIAGSTVQLGNLLGSQAVVITDEHSADKLRYLGCRLPIHTVESLGRRVDLGGGRVFEFVPTPYLRTPSSFVSFDVTTETLLSGHLFAARAREQHLVAQPEDIEDVLHHHEVEMPSSEVLAQCLANVRQGCPTLQRIFPASGYVLPHGLIDRLFSELAVLECGAANLRSSTAPPMVHLAGAVRRLREHVPLVRGLAELDRALRAELAAGIPVLDIAFESEVPGEGIVRFSAADDFGGTLVRRWSEGDAQRLVLEVAGEIDDVRVQLVVNTTAPATLDRDAQMLLPVLWPSVRRIVQRSVETRADRRERRLLDELSKRDPLTGLYNRRVLDTMMPTGDTRGVLMIRVEGFAGINEDAGYDIGDLALQRLSSVLSSTVRQGDVVIRYDGVDFLAVVRVVDRQELAAVADRLRMAVAAVDLGAISGSRSLTASIGGTLLNPDEPLQSARRRADEALYDARRFGRDSVAFKLPASV